MVDLQAVRHIGSNAFWYGALGNISSRESTFRLERRHRLLYRYISFENLREAS
jgi:hypothetical protein